MKAISAFEGCSAECGPTLKRGDSLVKAISAFEGCSAECGATLKRRDSPVKAISAFEGLLRGVRSNSQKRRFTGEGDLRR